jgi:large subunit ribosomal protein L9
MKVILTTTVKGTGKAGEVKEVADGYARNFLIPRRLAVPATDGALKGVAQKRAAESRRELNELADAQALADRLAETPVVLSAKVGEQGRLYGSITTADMADQLSAQLGHAIDKRHIQLADPIKQLGTYKVPVRLHRAVTATITVEVQPIKSGV